MKARKMIVLAVTLVLATALWGDTPNVNITGPTGTQFAASFPYSAQISFEITHTDGGLGTLNVLDVKVNGVSILPLGTIGNPFNTDSCHSSMDLAHGITSCSVASGKGTVSAAWTVPGPGEYSISVSVRHQSATGEDEEAVEFLLVSVEYPAPPAEANAFINSNSTNKLLYGKKRGCIVSKIAEEHAKNQKYGPKGGPYTPLQAIYDDVAAFSAQCQ